jgi:hypothetical protein
MRQVLLRLLLPIERRRAGKHPALEAAARWQEAERRAAVQRIYEQARAEDRQRP